MGGGTYSESAYHGLRSSRLVSHNVAAFTHTADVREGRAERAVHPRLDPKGVVRREARDSAEHPASLPIGVWFDVTGSMHQIPVVLQAKLSRLMALLVGRGFATDPQVLFGAIGDARATDTAPLQVGQFESNVQMDEDLDKVFLEGGGGGSQRETYELAYYFHARHTVTDAWEKRQKKGYLFTIGDEMPYDAVRSRDIQRLIGGQPAETDVTTDAIVAECQQRWHCYHLMVPRGSNYVAGATDARWRQLLGDHALTLDDPDHVAELVAAVVGLTEGTVTMEQAAAHLAALGCDPAAISTVRRAADPLVRAIALTR